MPEWGDESSLETVELPDVRPLALASDADRKEYRSILRDAKQAVLRAGGPPIRDSPGPAPDEQPFSLAAEIRSAANPNPKP